MKPVDLDPKKLGVPDLAPKPVLLDHAGKPEKSHAERSLDAAKKLLGAFTREQEILEAEAASNRSSLRRGIRLQKLATTIERMRAPGRARALRRRRAKNAVAKQSRKANR